MLTLLQIILAPVVLISACGLLCLALYNRLSANVSRARVFHREMFDVQTQLSQLDRAESALEAQLQARLDALFVQTRRIIARARKIRNALTCMLLTIISMLTCSLLLASLVPLAEPAQLASGVVFTTSGPLRAIVIAAGIVFVVGIVLMISAMVLAILELRSALDPVRLEHRELAEIENTPE